MNKTLFLILVIIAVVITVYFANSYPLYTIIVLAGLAAVGFFIEAVVTKSSKQDYYYEEPFEPTEADCWDGDGTENFTP